VLAQAPVCVRGPDFIISVLTILAEGASLLITPLHLAGALTRIPKIAPAFIAL
jgi:hypothetical protein